jgi:hypothetical protein
MLIVKRNTLTPNDVDDRASMALAERLVAETEHERLHPNKAHALGRAKAMSRMYGKEIDVDRLPAARGRIVDAAMKRYETFHKKDPIDVRELSHDPPARVVCVGDALAVAYRTDKWKKDGDDIDYKHVHEGKSGGLYPMFKGVKLYEPASEYRKSLLGKNPVESRLKEQGPPVRYPKAFTRLGYCLGVWCRRYDVDEGYFSAHPRGCDLYCSPSGNLLGVYSPEEQPDGSIGWLAIMAGGNLRVIADGIDG